MSTRMERLSMPLAQSAIRQLTEAAGGCTRPVQLRRTDTTTGKTDQILVPCGSTREDQCPACAKRAASLRAQQCREGWHLTADPEPPAPVPDDEQEAWLLLRAEAQVRRDHALAANADTSMLDELIGELDDHITAAGIRGTLTPNAARPARRSRSTRRRQDAPDLPSRPIAKTTTGRTYTSPDGKTWQPSMFVTLTCDTYGKVGAGGVPADPASYDYQRAARDALHFAALFDRFIQNLRRYAGQDVQYFATIEPQKRLAPHVHLAIRGTISRADLRQIIAATYHQVWWPPASDVRYPDGELPEWHEASGRFLDPATGEFLPSWDDALDAIGPHDQPLHVARFGPKFDAQGVLAGSKDAGRCIRYLTKYLTKQLGTVYIGDSNAAASDHADRLVQALKYEPCSPGCSNWLRYGINPKNPRLGMRPGLCRGKAHRRAYLGYAGRRVLVSRRWSGKTLTDHKADRRAWLVAMLGLPDLPATDAGRYSWQRVTPGDPDHMPTSAALLHVLTERTRQRAALELARRSQHGPSNLPATRRAA